jgi:hypothetical protein
MKITASQLRRIIREEVENVIGKSLNVNVVGKTGDNQYSLNVDGVYYVYLKKQGTVTPEKTGSQIPLEVEEAILQQVPALTAAYDDLDFRAGFPGPHKPNQYMYQDDDASDRLAAKRLGRISAFRGR